MTALAVALVLCCAMVCGIRLYDLKHNERLALCMKDRRDVNALAARLDALDEAMREGDNAHAALRSEVESLRAQVALRSV